MCGINGFFGVSWTNAIIPNMNAQISHRGPDASGVWTGENCALGHVRLSIIDLSVRSNQPFVKNGLVIVFNGEIYNYQEIRKELTGVEFISDSDTEVILEAWRRWGEKSLDKLRGMFAFAIHDINAGQSWLVRDHFGIKPLFYFVKNNDVLFSSELAAIEVAVRSDLALNETALVASMLYAWVPEEHCIWKDVEKLKPGCLLKIKPGCAIEIVKYWDAKSLIKDRGSLLSDETPAIEVVNNVLLESVKAHLVSDVPVNAFLSGGLDSSLIVAMAKQDLESLDCYTIKFSSRDKKYEGMVDDAYYAEKVAKILGVRIHTIEVQPNISELLPKIVEHLGEPIGDSAAISTYLICDAAHKAGVKVLLSGMGADELFAGYRKHYANMLAAKYRKFPKILRRALLEWPLAKMPVASDSAGYKAIRWAKRFVAFAGLEQADAFFGSYTYYNDTELDEGFVASKAKEINQIKKEHHKTYNAFTDTDPIGSMCFTDVNRFMTSLNLTYSDRASMAASTEIRVPFIDRKVAECAFSVASTLKIKNGQQKYILKKVAEKWLPKEIIYRPKSSFTLPLRSWIRTDLVDMVDDYILSKQGLSSRGAFKKEFLEKLVVDDRIGKSDNAQKIWHLLTLEQWFRNHRM